MTPARFRWGLLLITIGVMLLLNNTDHLDWEYWIDLLQWWPLILIAIGIEKIFLHSRLRFISYLSPLILVAAMVYVAFNTGVGYERGDFFSSYRWSQELGSDISRTEAVIKHGESDLYLKSGNIDKISARINRFTRKPRIDYSESGETASLFIEGRSRYLGGAIVISRRHYNRRWNVTFARDVTLSLNCIGEDSDVNLNLAKIPVEDIRVENDDGDINIRIGDKCEDVHLTIRGDDARLQLDVPENCGIKVTGGEFAGYFEAIGMSRDGHYFITDGFDAASIRLTMNIDGELRHLSINRY